MQSSIKASDSMKVRRQKKKPLKQYLPMAAEPGAGSGSRTEKHKSRPSLQTSRQTGRGQSDKNTMSGVLDISDGMMKESFRFQSIWEKEDGTALVFFSNVIQDIQTYINNWTTFPAPNIHWFLIKKNMRRRGCK